MEGCKADGADVQKAALVVACKRGPETRLRAACLVGGKGREKAAAEKARVSPCAHSWSILRGP